MLKLRLTVRLFAVAASWAVGLVAGSVDASAQAPTTISLPPSARIPQPVLPLGTGVGFIGKSVDISAGKLIVGANGGTGTALIYDEATPGNWVFVQRLTDPITSQYGGDSVAIDGDFAIVGAPFDSLDSDFGEGGAVFHSRSGSSWGVDLALTSTPWWEFGWSVDLSGDTAIIGAPYDGSLGSVSFRHFDGTQWNHVLSSSGVTPWPGGLLGESVAISGNIAVASNSRHATEPVVIYRRSGTTWLPAQTIDVVGTPELAAEGIAGTGRIVAIDGTTLLAWVAGPLPNSEFKVGIAVFEDHGSGFVYQQLLEASDVTSSTEGFASQDFDVRGDYIIAGAHKVGPRGAAYLFRRGANGLFAEEAKFVPTGGEFVNGLGTLTSPEFGYSVALSDDTLVIGARFDDGFGTAYILPLKGATGAGDFEAFCFGNGGASPGCTDCPCGNNADSEVVGGCLNSDGASAVLSILGEASASSDTARLELARAKAGAMVLLASSARSLPFDLNAGPCPRGSGVRSALFDGLRCIGGPIVRHGARVTDSEGAAQNPSDGWGGQFAPASGLVAQGGFAIGQPRFFQAIYRDDAALNCGSGLNTTNAVSILVVP